MSVSVQRQKNEPYCEEIYRLLKSFAEGIEYRGWNNLTEWHQYAEDVMRSVLEPTFDYKLTNANINKPNAAAIDLEGVDSEGKPVVIQVSSDDSRGKIQTTLNNKRLDGHASDHLVFMFLVDKHVTYKEDAPFGNPHGVQFDPANDVLDIKTLLEHIRHHSDPNRSKVVRDRLCRELKQNSPTLTDVEVAVLVNEELRKEHRDHQSFQLIYHSPVQELLPKGEVCRDSAIIPNADRSVVPEGQNESVPFARFIQDSWQVGEQRHLFITGKGGIGKTVALLTFATEQDFLTKNVPAIYIPLYRLVKRKGKKAETIEYVSVSKYIREKFGKKLARVIEGFSRRRWVDGPSVILLLDGHNELPNDISGNFADDIEGWAKRSGVQIVVTSRNVGLYSSVYMHRLELNELTAQDVGRYLSARKRTVPTDGDPLWRVLTTPLMLKVYDDVALFQERFKDANWLSLMEDSNSAGHLIWNYLQVELYRCVDKMPDTPRGVDYACALLLVLPYMCWKMEQAGRFELDQRLLWEYVREACEYWNERRRPSSAESIESWLMGKYYDGNSSHIVIGVQQQILTSERALLYKKSNRFVLMHQEFRDALAAVHLRNAAEVADGEVPEEYDASISDRVKAHFADITTLKMLLSLWEANRKSFQVHTYATRNLLWAIHRRTRGDISFLSFAGMDLRNVSLFAFRKSIRLMLGKNVECFEKTNLSASCFMPSGHSASVSSVCYSSDGQRLASGSNDGAVRLWDVVSRKEVSVLANRGDFVLCVCFSPNENLLASCSDDGTVRVWNVRKIDKLIENKDHSNELRSICFSPDGSLLAVGSDDGTIRLWDVRSQEGLVQLVELEPLVGHAGSVRSVCFRGDGALASGSDDGTVRLWDARSNECIEVLEGGPSRVRAISFSPDGQMLAAGLSDGTVRLWDSKLVLMPVVHTEQNWSVLSVSFSADGEKLALGLADGTICIRYLNSEHDAVKLRCSYGGAVRSVCYLSGKNILAAGYDDGMIRLWDTDNGIELPAMKSRGGLIRSVCFSPKGDFFACASSDGAVRIWDVNKSGYMSVIPACHGWVRSICFSSDGSVLLAGYDDGTVCLWNPYSKEEVCSYTYYDNRSFRSACISLSGDNIAIGYDDGAVRLINNHDRFDRLVIEDARDWVRSICFSPDGSLLAVGSDDGTIRLWDVRSQEGLVQLVELEPLVGHAGSVRSVCFRGDGALASGSDDGTVRLWDARSNECIEVLEGGPSRVRAISFSPDGQMLAAGLSEGTARIWIGKQREIQPPFGNHTDWITSVCFSPDSKLVAIGSDDGTVSMWDSSTREEVDTINVLHGIDLCGLDFSHAIISASDCRILHQNGVTVSLS